jgi:hypothetical protein
VKAPKVAVLLPSRDLIHADGALSLLNAVDHARRTIPGIEFTYHNYRSAMVAQLRNDLAQSALDVSADCAVFIDSDQTYPPILFNQLIAHDRDIVAVPCPKREMNPTACCFESEDLSKPIEPDASRGLVEVALCGTGIMLIKCVVFRTLPKPWFANVWLPEIGRLLGEDLFFCSLARECGFKIHADLSLARSVGHIGSHCYAFGNIDPVPYEGWK